MMWAELSTTLTGELIELQPLSAHHADGLQAAARDEQISTWFPAKLHEQAGFDAWFAYTLQESAEGREAPFATVSRADGSILGSTRFMALCPQHRRVEIGSTWLASAAWRTGANVEAKLLMLGHAFERVGCIRVELKTDARNERSRRAMEALPAQFEGIHRQHYVLRDGTLRDSAWYSVIDREWPDVRANLERRLAARLAA
jgi:RimJ/RimL family protein N-acetyltransferase